LFSVSADGFYLLSFSSNPVLSIQYSNLYIYQQSFEETDSNSLFTSPCALPLQAVIRPADWPPPVVFLQANMTYSAMLAYLPTFLPTVDIELALWSTRVFAMLNGELDGFVAPTNVPTTTVRWGNLYECTSTTSISSSTSYRYSKASFQTTAEEQHAVIRLLSGYFLQFFAVYKGAQTAAAAPDGCDGFIAASSNANALSLVSLLPDTSYTLVAALVPGTGFRPFTIFELITGQPMPFRSSDAGTLTAALHIAIIVGVSLLLLAIVTCLLAVRWSRATRLQEQHRQERDALVLTQELTVLESEEQKQETTEV